VPAEPARRAASGGARWSASVALRVATLAVVMLAACTAPMAPPVAASGGPSLRGPAPPREALEPAPAEVALALPATEEPPTPPASEEAPTPPPSYDEARLSALRRRLGVLLAGKSLAGASVGALAIELGSGLVIFKQGAEKPLVPASNEKLFTTAASVGLLGADHRMLTRVAASSEPRPDGGVAELYLIGDQDLGWTKHARASAAEPLERLARAVRERGIRRVDGALHVMGEPLLDADRFGTLDPGEHRARVASRFRQALVAAGVSAQRTALSPSFALPAGAPTVAEWRSEPLIEASATINQLSHNELADGLLRHLGLARRGESTPAAGAAEALAWLTSSGVPTEALRMVDGSGLSRENRTSARALVALLRLASRAPWGDGFSRTLAVAGRSGTLARRMRGPNTDGRVAAKTGSLDGVVSLSGYLQSRHDGRRYAFSLLFNGVKSAAAARKVEDRFLEELASAWQG
jgi:serine-type D-Ala-D-Ala carboxypeptidase/endopeptidase (penicillin-binding protein 4)